MRVHTVHTYTVAHAPSRADFTRDLTSTVSCRATGAGIGSAGDPVQIPNDRRGSTWSGAARSAKRLFIFLREGEFVGCLRK